MIASQGVTGADETDTYGNLEVLLVSSPTPSLPDAGGLVVWRYTNPGAALSIMYL